LNLLPENWPSESAGFANQNPGGAVTAGAAAGQKNCALGVGFGGFGVLFALVNARDNDSGSGFAFHVDLLVICDLSGIFLMPGCQGAQFQNRKSIYTSSITQKHTVQLQQ